MVSASGNDIINPLKHKLLENVSHKITKFSTNTEEWRNEAKTYLTYIKLYPKIAPNFEFADLLALIQMICPIQATLHSRQVYLSEAWRVAPKCIVL